LCEIGLGTEEGEVCNGGGNAFHLYPRLPNAEVRKGRGRWGNGVLIGRPKDEVGEGGRE
jgi:hypothetical protein